MKLNWWREMTRVDRNVEIATLRRETMWHGNEIVNNWGMLRFNWFWLIFWHLMHLSMGDKNVVIIISALWFHGQVQLLITHYKCSNFGIKTNYEMVLMRFIFNWITLLRCDSQNSFKIYINSLLAHASNDSLQMM